LRDVIDSREVRVVRLNAIFRQSQTSYIVQNAHRILIGERPISCERGDPMADFFVVERKEGDKAADTIRDLFVQRIPSGFGLDPLKDVQVLCPMHRGPTGTTQLNTALQLAVNPGGPALERKGFAFRVGDRVMQLKNDYERDVFNGDVGFVTDVDPDAMTLGVQFDGRTIVYSDADVDALTLAYATSIHKSQGSEYPAVIIPFLTSHFVMLSRNLLYTAVTRARRLCVLVADPKAIDLALSELKREQRATTLAERIRTAAQRARS
jgi:exodeoxyribonuclease V alpha subunit